ncbi:hypothetical protein C7271_21505, partial [filamentous cyanobacterium CCP5]
MGGYISVVGLTLAVCLGLVHIFVSRARWLAWIPESWWISGAGGVSIAYIFLDIFPEFNQAQTEVEDSGGWLVGYLE